MRVTVVVVDEDLPSPKRRQYPYVLLAPAPSGPSLVLLTVDMTGGFSPQEMTGGFDA